MELYRDDRIVLRDMIPADTEDYIRWNTELTDWKDWDGPWEREAPFDEAAYREKMKGWLQNAPADGALRRNCELATADGRHIGWVCSYLIDDDCCPTDGPGHVTVGIDICEPDCRGGTGSRALAAFCRYLLKSGMPALYMQTWSGNLRMIKSGAKLGFVEVRRKKDLRLVRGERYDGLTFRLDLEQFAAFCRQEGID